jgi:hypothetical protein
MQLLLLFINLFLFQKCPPQGDNKNPKIMAADLLKNRSWCPDKNKAAYRKLSDLMKDKLQDTSLIYVEAYITSAKISGAESCQCHDNNPETRDYHIYISARNTKDKKQNQIVEVTRYSRMFNNNLNFQYVKSLIGHKVRIYGYTFMDEEHKSGIGNWRAGIQEIHPVMYIDKID